MLFGPCKFHDTKFLLKFLVLGNKALAYHRSPRCHNLVVFAEDHDSLDKATKIKEITNKILSIILNHHFPILPQTINIIPFHEILDNDIGLLMVVEILLEAARFLNQSIDNSC